jgi:hypothetical protein
LNTYCLLLVGLVVSAGATEGPLPQPTADFHFGLWSFLHRVPLSEDEPAWQVESEGIFAVPDLESDDEFTGMLWFRLPPPPPPVAVHHYIRPEPRPLCAAPAPLDVQLFGTALEFDTRRFPGDSALTEFPTCPLDPVIAVLLGDPSPQTKQDAWQTMALIGVTGAIHTLRHANGDGPRGGRFRRIADITDDLLQPDDESQPFKQVRPPFFFTWGINY